MSSPPNLPFVSMSQVQPYHHELGRHRMNSAPPSLPSRYNPYPSPPSHFSPTPPTQIDINPHKCKPEFEHLLNQNDGEYHHDQFGVPSEGSFFSSVLFPDVSSSPWSSSPEISPEPQGRAPLPHWIMGRDSSPVSPDSREQSVKVESPGPEALEFDKAFSSSPSEPHPTIEEARGDGNRAETERLWLAPIPACGAGVGNNLEEKPSMRRQPWVKFPDQLRCVLEDPKYKNCLRWSPDGKEIVCWHKHQDWKNLLPMTFGHKNYPSFTRQLNVYNFIRIPTTELQQLAFKIEGKAGISTACQGWRHPSFVRDRPDLALTMGPRAVKSRIVTKTASIVRASPTKKSRGKGKGTGKGKSKRDEDEDEESFESCQW